MFQRSGLLARLAELKASTTSAPILPPREAAYYTTPAASSAAGGPAASGVHMTLNYFIDEEVSCLLVRLLTAGSSFRCARAYERL